MIFKTGFKLMVLPLVVYQRTAGPLGPVLKKILEDWSVQDLKIAKRTSKDLFFDFLTIIHNLIAPGIFDSLLNMSLFSNFNGP